MSNAGQVKLVGWFNERWTDSWRGLDQTLLSLEVGALGEADSDLAASQCGVELAV